jgi:hypothetical protein
MKNSENSKGTQNEIKRAKELGIPIYYSLEELIKARELENSVESK